MLKAIKYNLAHLTQFRGRDAKPTFWFYVLFLVLVHIAVSLAVSIPMTGAMMGDTFSAVRDGAGDAAIQQRMFARIGAMMRVSMWASVLLSLAMIGLLSASFTRRLHDSGKPGWIVLIVVAVQLVVIGLTVARMDEVLGMLAVMQTGDMESISTMQSRFALQGLLAWLPAIVVLVFGLMPSTVGENRYGPQPLPA